MKLILGTGQLGMAILEALLGSNPDEAITLVNRSGKTGATLPNNVQLVAADATNPHEMEFLARDAEVIFSCTDVPYTQWAAFYPAMAHALAYALSRTTARLVFADNLYSYGNMAGAVMHEGLPHNATTKKGAIRTAVINTLLLNKEDFASRVAIVKAADFIGPNIYKGLLGRDFLERLHRNKTILLFGRPGLPHTFTYIKDFATAMVQVGTAPDTYGQVWHVPNAPAISPKEWIRLFEQETGKKATIKTLPKWMVRVAGLFSPLTRELYELAYQFEFAYLVDHAKYVRRFGNHATGHAAIVKETVAWFRQNKRS